MMLKTLRLAIALTLPVQVLAQQDVPDPGLIVDGHILPGFRLLDDRSKTLAFQAQTDCRPDYGPLIADYQAAFDAWVAVSHLRFGPTETGDRAFALAFWPDSRGATPKALAALIAAEDPVIDTADSFATVSIAARGFYALDYLLFDPAFAAYGRDDYTCQLVQAVARDIAINAAAIHADWRDSYGDAMRHPGSTAIYRNKDEVLRELFKALSAGLEFATDTRLGRPLGSFDRPRPNRAEARRSGRSLRHVILSLQGTRALAGLLSDGDETLDKAFARALMLADRLDDPVFAGVATPQGRLRVEALQQAIGAIRAIVTQQLGPRLGVAAGFNALDGD